MEAAALREGEQERLRDVPAVAPPRPRHAGPADRGLIAYAALTAAGAVAGVVATVHTGSELLRQTNLAFWMIGALAIVVAVRPVPVTGSSDEESVSPSIAFTFALMLGWGLVPAIAVQVVAIVVSTVRLRPSPWRPAVEASQYALAFTAANLALTVAGVPPLSTVVPSPAGVVAILVALCVWLATNEALVITARWLRFGGRWSDGLAGPLRQDVLLTLALLTLGLLVVAAGNVSAVFVPLILVPLYAVDRLARYSEEERRTALLDELTGLPNRRALFAEMSVQARAHTQRSSRLRGDRRRMALVLLDIDQFRRVNDALGHGVGDRLLKAVAGRLVESMGTDGFVARLGGDEFGVLAPRLKDHAAVSVLAQRVAHALAEPITLEGLPLDVTAAVGVAVHPEHGQDNTTLLRHAEAAMYDAKNRGAQYALYTPESDQNSVERLELLADLRRALESPRRDEIHLVYQPQINLVNGEVVGVEALLRWRHPVRGVVSPEHLIKVAEHTAVMRLLTSRVLDDAIGQLAAWRAQGLELRVSINVSVRDLHRAELVEDVAARLAARGVPPNQIQLEITEGALIVDPRRVMVTLHRLDRLGVALSLDDFGTGYSSLQHLRRLPLAEVKIDRSFVLGMTQDPDDAAVVDSIIDLARALGLRVVAEGVEDEHTRAMLLNTGCEVAQGWYYARPMPADELVGWLARYRPPPRLS